MSPRNGTLVSISKWKKTLVRVILTEEDLDLGKKKTRLLYPWSTGTTKQASAEYVLTPITPPPYMAAMPKLASSSPSPTDPASFDAFGRAENSQQRGLAPTKDPEAEPSDPASTSTNHACIDKTVRERLTPSFPSRYSFAIRSASEIDSQTRGLNGDSSCRRSRCCPRIGRFSSRKETTKVLEFAV
ncbi:hypothetical protein U1Q18_009378 [Sarracenia purpurea var. burkii]